MGFFSNIVKAVSKVGKAVGGVAKKAFPTVLSLAKSVVPGGNLIGGAIEMAVGGLGGSSNLSNAIVSEVSSGGSVPSGVGSKSARIGGSVRRKVVIYT